MHAIYEVLISFSYGSNSLRRLKSKRQTGVKTVFNVPRPFDPGHKKVNFGIYSSTPRFVLQRISSKEDQLKSVCIWTLVTRIMTMSVCVDK